MKKGIASIEILLLLAGLAGSSIVIIEIQKNGLETIQKTFDFSKQKASAVSCAVLIDSAFANNTLFSGINSQCTTKEHAVYINGKKRASIINQNTTTKTIGNANSAIAIKGIHYAT